MLATMPDDRYVIGLLEHLEAAARIAFRVKHVGSVAEAIGPAAAGQMGFRNLRAGVAIKGGNVLADSSRAFPRKLLKRDRKSTRLNSSHRTISYAVFCLKKKP